MRKLSAVSTVIGLASIAPISAEDLHVPEQYLRIQTAIDAAAPGNRIVVGPGIYFETLLIEKAVTLVSSEGAADTIIDGRRLGVVVVVEGTGSEAVEIAGFTIVNGMNSRRHSPPGPRPGPTMGGGLYAERVELTLTDNVVRDNIGCGGTISTFTARVTIERNRIENNVRDPSCSGGGAGGGIFIRGPVDGLAVVANNHISGHAMAGAGGGIAVQGMSDIAILDNVIEANNASGGGGIFVVFSSGLVRGNWLIGNTAETGGAMQLIVQNPDERVAVAQNHLVDNDASVQGSSVDIISYYPGGLRLTRNDISGSSAVELISCLGEPYRVNPSNQLVNESGPELGSDCLR